MKAPLFDDIITICQAIAEASSQEDEQAREQHYQALIRLCSTHDNSPRNHPLQWQALADFTLDGDQAIDIYKNALAYAEKMNLVNSQASIYLSMAMRFQEMDNLSEAKQHATLAFELSDQIDNEELIADIKAFYQQFEV
ncbi:hypothetical protein [Thalassotalea ganghwensis]